MVDIRDWIARGPSLAQLSRGDEGESVGGNREKGGEEEAGGHQVEIFCEHNRQRNVVCEESGNCKKTNQ